MSFANVSVKYKLCMATLQVSGIQFFNFWNNHLGYKTAILSKQALLPDDKFPFSSSFKRCAWFKWAHSSFWHRRRPLYHWHPHHGVYKLCDACKLIWKICQCKPTTSHSGVYNYYSVWETKAWLQIFVVSNSNMISPITGWLIHWDIIPDVCIKLSMIGMIVIGTFAGLISIVILMANMNWISQLNEAKSLLP